MQVSDWPLTTYFFRVIALVWLVTESGMAVRKAIKAEKAPLWWPFWVALWGVAFLAAVAADLWIFTARA